MQTTITPVNSVEYDFEITIPASELTPYVDSKLKQLRPKVKMNGFRQGKVPKELVKKLYGESAAFEVADKFVQDTFEEEVVENPEYELVGRSKMIDFEFKYGEDLRSVIRFGVMPQFDLQSLEDEKVSKLVNPVTDEDVDSQIEYLRTREADKVASETGIVEEKSILTVDMQGLHPETGAEFPDRREEDGVITMNNPQLLDEFKEALLGKAKGDVVEVRVEHKHEHDDEHAHDHEHHTDVWRITIKEVSDLVLPALDEAFIEKVSHGAAKTEQEMRDIIRETSGAERNKRSTERMHDKLIQRVINLHDFEVPSTLVDLYLDVFVKNFKDEVTQENQGRLPSDFENYFNEEMYRNGRAKQAADTAKWMLIRDRIVEDHKIEADEDSILAEYDAMAKNMGGGIMDAQRMRELYEEHLPDQAKEMTHKAINAGVLAVLESQATIVEKGRADFEIEEKAEEEAHAAEQAKALTEMIAAQKAAQESAEAKVEDGIEDAVYEEIVETKEDAS